MTGNNGSVPPGAEDPRVEDPRFEDSRFEDSPLWDPPVEDSPLGDPPVEDSPLGDPPVEDSPLGDPDIAGVAGNPISHLDGNTAAGALGELFRIDIIAAIGRCRHCGSVRAFGEASVYVDAPGIVVRCSACEGVLLRLVETPTRYWLDVSGLSYLQIDREG